MAKKKNAMQSILEYNQKYGHIPKDYLERLAWIYKEHNYSREQLNSLINKLDLLTEMEWNEVTYIFYMDPKATPRPRLNTHTFTFYVPGAKMNKEIYDNFKAEHSDMDTVITTPCIMETKVYISTPKSMTMEEKLAAELELIHNINAPDWDNLGKAYSDMVQDTLVSNDSIICKGSVEKFYSVLPRIEVNVKFMMKYDCKYNKKTVENRKSFKENNKVIRGLDYII